MWQKWKMHKAKKQINRLFLTNFKTFSKISLLFLILFLLMGCIAKKEPQIQFIPIECDDSCEEYKLQNDALISKYNDLVTKHNKLIEERDFWKNEDLKKAQQIELCKDEDISVPKKTLYKKTFCNYGCDYILYNTGSMLPFFDYNDKLTFYTNVLKNEIEVCDIIAFESPEYPSPNSKPFFAIHQVINIDLNGYTTKGVANIYPDSYTVQFEDIMGKLINVEYR